MVIDTLWQELLACSRVRVAPCDLDGETPAWFADLARLGYPQEPIYAPFVDGKPNRYEGSVLFPIPALLKRMQNDDSDWPRDWLPLAVTGDHYIQFLKGEERAVWSVHTDDGVPYEATIEYVSFEAFLRAAIASVKYVRTDNLIEKTTGIWPFRRKYQELRPEIVACIERETSNDADGPRLLPQCQVEPLRR